MIPGSVSREVFEAQLDEHAGRHILVYCTAGCRSGAYARELPERGLSAFNLRDGVPAWAVKGGSVVSPSGEGTRREHGYDERWNVLPPEYEAVR
jgi:hypothetical protein